MQGMVSPSTNEEKDVPAEEDSVVKGVEHIHGIVVKIKCPRFPFPRFPF